MNKIFFKIFLITLFLTIFFPLKKKSFAKTLIGAKGGIYMPGKDKVKNGAIFLLSAGSILDDFDIYLDFGYREFERKITLDVSGSTDKISADTPVKSFPLLFNFRYKLSKKKIIPFLGAGAGLSVNIMDFTNVENEANRMGAVILQKSEFGTSLDLHLLGGIKVYLSEKLYFIGEPSVSTYIGHLTSNKLV